MCYFPHASLAFRFRTRCYDELRASVPVQALAEFHFLTGLTAAKINDRGDTDSVTRQTPLDTPHLPGPFREPGLDRAATGQARGLLGGPLREHRQSFKTACATVSDGLSAEPADRDGW